MVDAHDRLAGSRDRQRDESVADAVFEHGPGARARELQVERDVVQTPCVRRRIVSGVFVVGERPCEKLSVGPGPPAAQPNSRLFVSSMYSATASLVGRSKCTLDAAISRSAVTAALFFE